jgi:hypothetical protein
VALSVSAPDDSLRWSYTLENTSGGSVDVLADRRLLWLEVAPAPAVKRLPPPATRVRSIPRAVRCIAPDRPTSNAAAPRTVLMPGERYTEGFDLRDLCGLDLPRALGPGAVVTVHYGFRGRPSVSQAVVLDNQAPPLTDLVSVAPVTIGQGPWPPPSPPAPPGDPRIRVRVSGALDGETVAQIHPAVRLVREQPYPLHVFFRPGLVRFEVITPLGQRVDCLLGLKDYAPVRDLFVLLGRDGITHTLQLSAFCPAEALAQPGTYRGRAIYESLISGEAFGFQTFLGSASSPYFFFRITRGAPSAQYQPLPSENPFADVTDSSEPRIGEVQTTQQAP